MQKFSISGEGMMKLIPKNNFLEEFIKAYDKEWLGLSNLLKKEIPKDNFDKIKYKADNILEETPDKKILQDIFLEDYEGDFFVEFISANDTSLFVFYDNENNKVLRIVTQSILSLIKETHPDLIEYQVVEISNGEIKGLTNKYNAPELLESANNTKNIINDLYEKMGLKERVRINSVNDYYMWTTIKKYHDTFLSPVEEYYNNFLSSSFFKYGGNVPLSLKEEEKDDYVKRFLKDFSIKDCNIYDYLKNFKEIYEMLKSFSGFEITPQMFKQDDFLNMVIEMPHFELRVHDDDLPQYGFDIFVKNGLNSINILEEYIYINDNKSDIFLVKDVLENKREVINYLEAIKY